MIGFMIVTEITILCCKVGRSPPYNYLLLLIFTLSEAYMVSFICAIVSDQESDQYGGGRPVVLMAAIMTLGMNRFKCRYCIGSDWLCHGYQVGLYNEVGFNSCGGFLNAASGYIWNLLEHYIP
jgi:hypothetical protein